MNVNLKNSLLDLENNYLKKNDVNQALENFKNKVKTILNDYYGEKITFGGYDFLKQITNERITNVLEDLGDKWIDLFSNLKKEVTNNLNNYKNSINEFGIMAKYYKKFIFEILQIVFMIQLYDIKKRI